jgi:hypothetical protein
VTLTWVWQRRLAPLQEYLYTFWANTGTWTGILSIFDAEKKAMLPWNYLGDSLGKIEMRQKNRWLWTCDKCFLRGRKRRNTCRPTLSYSLEQNESYKDKTYANERETSVHASAQHTWHRKQFTFEERDTVTIACTFVHTSFESLDGNRLGRSLHVDRLHQIFEQTCSRLWCREIAECRLRKIYITRSGQSSPLGIRFILNIF